MAPSTPRKRQGGKERVSRRQPSKGTLDDAYLEALKDMQGGKGKPEAASEADAEVSDTDDGRRCFGEQQQASVLLYVAPDGTEARLLELSLGGDLTVTLPSLMDALRDDYGIVAGIDEGLVDELFARATKAPASVVRGNFPIARVDAPPASEAGIEFLFATDAEVAALTSAKLRNALVADDQQAVLSQEVLSQLVTPDQELARVRAADVDASVNIFGEHLMGQAHEPQLVAGENVREANGTLISEIYGYAILEDGRLSVLSPIWVSADYMEAFFVRFPHRRAPDPPESAWLTQLLDMKRVSTGIDEPALEKLCRQSWPAAECTSVQIAGAQKPVDGMDARVEYAFDLDKKAGLVLEDGSIDLRERNASVSVAEGDLLGEFVPHTTGEAGYDLSGKDLPAKDGVERTFAAGENVREEDDGVQKFYAEVDGHVAIVGDTLHVRTVFYVGADLDYAVGNIDVPGDVQVTGSVKPGFSVKAGGSITIGGAVELGASVHAKGDVVASRGILGDTTRVVALGDIQTKHIQNSSVMAKGTITVGSYIFNANVRAGNQILVRSGGGERGGSIVGGEVIASQGIQARILGSPSTDRTIVGIGANPEDGASLAQLNKAQRHVEAETMRLLRSLGVDSADADGLKERLRLTPKPGRERVLRLMQKLNELEGKNTELLESSAALRVKVDESMSKARITITGAVFTDVHSRFGDATRIVNEDLGPSVFLWVDGKVRCRAP